jgi:hypothetical protein
MHAANPFEIELGDPSSWCDSACERCPLFGQCAVGQAVSQRLTRMHIEDGPTLAVEITRDLNRALLQLEDMCADEGIDPEAVEMPAIPPEVSMAESLGAELVRAVVALTRDATCAGRMDPVLSGALVSNATLMAVKCSRAAWAMTTARPLAADGPEPILLLIEHTSAQLKRDVRAVSLRVPASLLSRFADAHAALVDFMTPWIAMVTPESRRELRARIAAGCAPSPFCRRALLQAAS